MTKEEAQQYIVNWEMNAGESFFDYFAHGNIKDQSWAFFLIGKGYVKHANLIIDEILDGNTCLDQDLLYHVYNVDEEGVHRDEISKRADLNFMLMAEFLVSVPYYLGKFEKFLETH